MVREELQIAGCRLQIEGEAGPGWLPPAVRALYPFRPKFLDVGGARCAYVEEGRGEPVVLVHGNPTWSFFFRDLILGLRGRYRVVALDHVGCGLSDKPDDSRYEYRLARRADDLGWLLDHLGLGGGLTLVLHDWGGMIGMAWASRHPGRVRRLVVLNTAAFRMPAGKRLPWQLRLVRNTPLGPLLVRGLGAFSLGLVHACPARRLGAAVRAGYLAPYRSWNDRRAVLRFVQDIPLGPGDPSYGLVREVEEGLGRFRDVPMLVCWGRRDFVFDDDFLAGWKGRFPRAEVHTFADAGHLVLEDAGDRVVPLVRDFLQRHPLTP
jgi:haloalkane dehalogenase